jgi:hypothetical protein
MRSVFSFAAAVVLAACLQPASVAQEKPAAVEIEKGSTAYVVNDGAELILQDKVVGKLKKGAKFEVAVVSGNNIAGTTIQDGKKLSGWLRRTDLSPRASGAMSNEADDPKAIAALEKLRVSLEKNEADQVIRVSFNLSDATSDDLKHLQGLPNVQMVNLSNENLDDTALVHLKSLKYLSLLSVGYANVTDKGLAALADVPSLETLILYGTERITDKGLVHLASLERLHTLDLGATYVKGPGLQTVGRLPALRSLALFECQVDDTALDYLASCPALEELDLSRTKVTLSARAVGALKKIATLKTLSVSGLDFKDETQQQQRVEALKKSLPKVRVR